MQFGPLSSPLVKWSLGLILAFGLIACGSGTEPGGGDPAIPVPEDFSSTGYYLNNSERFDPPIDPSDSLALAQHYVDIGQALGWPYQMGGSSSLATLSEIANSSTPFGMSSVAQQSLGGLSSQLATSSLAISSILAQSSNDGTVPAGFTAAEYCHLNSDLQAAFSISSCLSLNTTQQQQLTDHFASFGAGEGRWYSISNQCSERLGSTTILPCDFDYFKYWQSCKAWNSALCQYSTSDRDSLEAHYWRVGKDEGLVYSGVPSDFVSATYRAINPELVSIYPTDDAQTMGWHYHLFGKGWSWQYKYPSSSSTVDPFADMVPITTEPAFKIIGFMMGGTNNNTWNDTYMSKMTHLIIFGPEVAADGHLNMINNTSDALAWWAYWGSKTDTRVMVAIGGWGKDAYYPTMVADDTKRANFINDLVTLMEDANLYGVDLDWEYPSGYEVTQFATLIREMKTAFNGRWKITVDVPATTAWADPLNADAESDVDWFNVMCYDGSTHATDSQYSGCKSAYSGSKSKAVVGWPAYAGTGTGAVSYHSGPDDTDATCTTNTCSYGGKNFVSQEGVAYRASDLQSSGYAGTMFWAVEHDNITAPSLLFSAASAVGYNP
jgi:hypothetical protein